MPGKTSTQLSGYSYPLSPSGGSSMITPPPWHFSGNMLWIEYAVDREAAQAFLPDGLVLSQGDLTAAAVFSEWEWCSADARESSDPVSCQFSEFQIVLACEHRGRPMARCPYAWVDSATSLSRGWIQGMPKQFGSVHLTRMFPLGRAGGRRRPGVHLSGSLGVHDRRFASATITLKQPEESAPPLARVPLVHSQMTSRWTGEEKTGSRLITSRVSGVEFGDVWSGSAELEFDRETIRVRDGDLLSLLPLETGAGYSFAYAETLEGGACLD
ncbi:acetoacetate decarboxylase family protein [Streptomyces pseudovenezuelae]|uniref:acetoacetate decarboxylase family protein n=1 Tax=Streptomyces pseudovenezuelae TaxID=67350 RepID=UPI0036EF521D